MLGIKSEHPAVLVDRIRKGLPSSAIDKFQKFTGLSTEELSQLVGIPRRSLSRRKKLGRLSPHQSDRLVRASTVFEEAVSLFDGDVDAAREWLLRPQRALGGETPLTFAQTEIGAREVRDLIGRLEHGVFT
jgi:putative toxin-antitoxin system antitoxin component (TIGR02293 family)